MGFGLFELNIPIGERVWGGGGYGAIVYMAVTGRGLRYYYLGITNLTCLYTETVCKYIIIQYK